MNKTNLKDYSLQNLLSRIDELIKQRLTEFLSEQQDSTNKSYYLTRGEVARLLRITLPTLHEWTRNGILPVRKIGKRVLFKRSEVEICVKERATQPKKSANFDLSLLQPQEPSPNAFRSEMRTPILESTSSLGKTKILDESSDK